MIIEIIIEMVHTCLREEYGEYAVAVHINFGVVIIIVDAMQVIGI